MFIYTFVFFVHVLEKMPRRQNTRPYDDRNQHKFTILTTRLVGCAHCEFRSTHLVKLQGQYTFHVTSVAQVYKYRGDRSKWNLWITPDTEDNYNVIEQVFCRGRSSACLHVYPYSRVWLWVGRDYLWQGVSVYTI